MVVRLAEALELSLRERNELLSAAGFAPVYAESSLEDPVLAPVREAIGHILRGHLPYPAVVVDRGGQLVDANGAFGVITEGAAAELLGPGTNVYRLALHPDGLAPRILNLAEWARHILARLGQLGQLGELRSELAGYLPELGPGDGALGFAVPLRLRSSYGDLRLMTTVTTFATAVDVTLAELKLEAFLPADAATAGALAAAARDQAPGNM